MELVDGHAHFLPDWYRDEAMAAGHFIPDGMPGWPNWSLDEHLRLMDEQGIQRSILSISSPGVYFGDQAAAIDLAARVNDYAADLQNAHPDRFRFFASLPLPDVNAALIELERAFELGAAGVIIESNVHGRYPADPEFEPIWQALHERSAPLFLHPTSPPYSDAVAQGFPKPVMEFLFDTTRAVFGMAVAGVLSRYPEMRVIMPHCGAVLPLLIERLEMFQRGFPSDGESQPESLTESLARLWFDLAGAPLSDQVPAIIKRFGPDHILFGSDYCFTPAALVAAQIAELDAGWEGVFPRDWRELVADNARTLRDSSHTVTIRPTSA